MEISKQTSYTKNGCLFQGNLLVIEYWDDHQEKSNQTIIEGFGQSNWFDYLEFIKGAMVGIKGKCKLAIPDYVFLLEEPMQDEDFIELAVRLGIFNNVKKVELN